MPQVIRQGLFETNSSSSHSFTIKSIKRNTKLDKMRLEPDGSIQIFTGQFGWGVEDFSHPEVKVSYVYTWILRYSSPEKRENYFKMLENVLLKGTGASRVDYRDGLDMSSGTNDCYIDHQSISVGGELLESEKRLYDFIFNPASILRIANDNM